MAKSERDGLQAGPSLDTAPSKPVRHVMLDSGSRPEWPVQARAGQARPRTLTVTSQPKNRRPFQHHVVGLYPPNKAQSHRLDSPRTTYDPATRPSQEPRTLPQVEWNIRLPLSSHRRYVAPVPPRQSPAERDGPPFALHRMQHPPFYPLAPSCHVIVEKKGGVLLRVRGSLCSGPSSPHPLRFLVSGQTWGLSGIGNTAISFVSGRVRVYASP